MKITNYGPTGINPYKRELQKADDIKKSTTNSSDQIEISSEALKLQQQTDPARQAKVANIKEQIQSGTYEINQQEIAKNMYNYHNSKQ